MKQRNLTLIVTKKWFDKYLSGEKREDYREEKNYWHKRLMNKIHYSKCIDGYQPKKFDKVIIKNGYGKNAPTIEFKHVSTILGFGNPRLGAPKDKECFIIKMM